ncbi:MAG: hypothetical protein ACO3IB_09165 [Phycisphaerales bacterium]
MTDPRDDEPHCPACGYSRAMLAIDARCPECGVDGFAGVEVIQGRPRFSDRNSRALLLVWLVPSVLFLLQIVISGRSSDIACLGIPLAISTIACVLLLVRSRRWGGTGPDARRVVWNIHPRGIEVCEGTRRDWIPRDAVARIDCTDSIIGETSQLMLIPGHRGRAGVLGRTRVMYIDGATSERRARWNAAKRVLGMDARAGSTEEPSEHSH